MKKPKQDESADWLKSAASGAASPTPQQLESIRAHLGPANPVFAYNIPEVTEAALTLVFLANANDAGPESHARYLCELTGRRRRIITNKYFQASAMLAFPAAVTASTIKKAFRLG